MACTGEQTTKSFAIRVITITLSEGHAPIRKPLLSPRLFLHDCLHEMPETGRSLSEFMPLEGRDDHCHERITQYRTRFSDGTHDGMVDTTAEKQ
jgi:hypothetical protein